MRNSLGSPGKTELTWGSSSVCQNRLEFIRFPGGVCLTSGTGGKFVVRGFCCLVQLPHLRLPQRLEIVSSAALRPAAFTYFLCHSHPVSRVICPTGWHELYPFECKRELHHPDPCLVPRRLGFRGYVFWVLGSRKQRPSSSFLSQTGLSIVTSVQVGPCQTLNV